MGEITNMKLSEVSYKELYEKEHEAFEKMREDINEDILKANSSLKEENETLKGQVIRLETELKDSRANENYFKHLAELNEAVIKRKRKTQDNQPLERKIERQKLKLKMLRRMKQRELEQKKLNL